MRTIKFRAKNLDGEWVYGFYVEEERQTLNGFEKKYFIVNDGYDYVKPDTVGQFTGLHDNDGKEIYEGDIILEKLKRSRKDGDLYEIVFEDCQWFGKNKDGAMTSLSLLNDFHVIKIIGNIHDNPKLLTNE